MREIGKISSGILFRWVEVVAGQGCQNVQREEPLWEERVPSVACFHPTHQVSAFFLSLLTPLTETVELMLRSFIELVFARNGQDERNAWRLARFMVAMSSWWQVVAWGGA